jgi:adenylate kinase family enzyme
VRQVVVIAGPPCWGKAPHAHALAELYGGLVLDREEIARAPASTRRWMHSKAISRAAELAMRAELVRITGMAEVRAEVIRSAPLPAQRAQLQVER